MYDNPYKSPVEVSDKIKREWPYYFPCILLMASFIFVFLFCFMIFLFFISRNIPRGSDIGTLFADLSLYGTLTIIFCMGFSSFRETIIEFQKANRGLLDNE